MLPEDDHAQAPVSPLQPVGQSGYRGAGRGKLKKLTFWKSHSFAFLSRVNQNHYHVNIRRRAGARRQLVSSQAGNTGRQLVKLSQK